MKRSQEESQGHLNKTNEQVSSSPLNLRLTKTPQLISHVDSIIKQYSSYPCHHQQHLPHSFTQNTNNLTSHETPNKLEKQKALNFAISKITIGQWTRTAQYTSDLTAKFYFAKKKLLWESLDFVERGGKTERLKRKIEMDWGDVLSIKPTFSSQDDPGILHVELSKPPTFFIETNPQKNKHTQWEKMDQDFTQDQSASICRRHTLHFDPGVLQENMGKLVSRNSFWSELLKINFPTLPKSLYFEIGYGNSPYQIGHMPVGEVINYNMETRFGANSARQMNTYVQDSHQNNSANQFLVTEGIQQSSLLIREDYNTETHFIEGQFSCSMILGESETMKDRRCELHRKQLHLLCSPVGPYQSGFLSQEEATQNMEPIQVVSRNRKLTLHMGSVPQVWASSSSVPRSKSDDDNVELQTRLEQAKKESATTSQQHVERPCNDTVLGVITASQQSSAPTVDDLRQRQRLINDQSSRGKEELDVPENYDYDIFWDLDDFI